MPSSLVLLTGATGMVGYRILIRLLQAGYSVRCAVRSTASFDRITSLAPTKPYLSQLSSVLVPDITVPGAYDEAVIGITYVIHVASPIFATSLEEVSEDDDFESSLLRPAVRGTTSMLEAAGKQSTIQRVVITGSMGSLVANIEGYAELITEDTRRHDFTRPFEAEPLAYIASKTLAFQAAKDFMNQNKGLSFDLVHILPVFVIGRDDTVTDPSQIMKGTNGCVMPALLGHPRRPVPGSTVHIDDVAEMHLLALDKDKVKGGEDFLASCTDGKEGQWADCLEIARRRFPEAVDDGRLKLVAPEDAPTVPNPVSNKKAREVMGIKFKSYEEQVVSVVEHYLELLGKLQ